MHTDANSYAGQIHRKAGRAAATTALCALGLRKASRAAATTALCALGLPGATGCLFWGDINSVPNADVQWQSTAEEQPYRGALVRFSAAQSTDPDGDALSVIWRAQVCDRARNCDDPLPERFDVAIDEPIAVRIPLQRANGLPTENLRVIGIVVDADGARDEDDAFVAVLNRAPTVTLQPQGPPSTAGSGYPVGASVRIVAEGTDPENDPLDLKWHLFGPQGPQFRKIAPTTWDFLSDEPGSWEVEVVATDSLQATHTDTVEVVVQRDLPPCVVSTEPPYQDQLAAPEARYIVDREKPPRRFAVLNVRDDLDSYPSPTGPDDEAANDPPSPLGTTGFRWFLASPDTDGDLVEVLDHQTAAYLLDASAYAPGDVISLRVEIADRVDRDIACDIEDSTCSVSGDTTCLQRITWNIEVR